MLLEQLYGTRIGAKPVSIRETVDQPARGIDCIGIEQNDRIKLIVTEVKVSPENETPPQVVETGGDSLKMQHHGHVSNPTRLRNKVMNASRHIGDRDLRDLFFAVAMLLESENKGLVDIVCCSVMLRPTIITNERDFGIFRSNPPYFKPGKLRFMIFRIPIEIEDFLTEWYELVQAAGAQSAERIN